MSGFGGFLSLKRYLAIAAFFICAALVFAVDVSSLPKPTGYVSDLAHVVSPDQKEILEQFCTKVEQDLGVQFALVTIDTLDGRPINDVALEIARKWGVGSKKDNQGVLLLLAIKDHQNRIEIGRGIEPYLTDGFSGSILRSMRPDLQSSDYGEALLTAAQAMAQQIAQGKGIAFTTEIPQRQDRREPAQRRGGGGIPIGLIIFGIFFLLALLGRGGRRGGGGFGGGGGLWTGILLGNLLSGGRRYDGGGWGGGGFGGGSGGGGGFGGFGGGDFGGGGASSNW